MSERIEYVIPPSTKAWLGAVPTDRPVAALIRHSVRGELPPGAGGNRVPITAKGEKLASLLGGMIGGRLQSLTTSPVLRCVQTAEAIRTGTGIQTPVRLDRALGDPGIYVLDGQEAW